MKTSSNFIFYIAVSIILLQACQKSEISKPVKKNTKTDSIFAAELLDTLKTYTYSDADSIETLYIYVENSAANFLSGDDFAFFLNKVGLVSYSKSNYYYAKKYFLKSAKIFNQNSNKHEAAKCFSNIGVILEITGSYKEAIETYFDAIDIFKENKDELSAAKVYNNIGVVFNKLKNYDKAIKYYKLSNKIKSQHNKNKLLAAGLDNIGTVFEATQDYDSSLYYYKKSLKLYSDSKDELNFATVNNNIGYILLMNKNMPDSAKRCFESSLKLFQKHNNRLGIVNTYRNIAYMYFLAGNYQKAITILNKAKNLFDSYKYIPDQALILKLLANSYEKNKNYKKAIYYFKKYQAKNDSVLHAENTKNINLAEIKYNVKEKDNEIKLLSAENKIKDFRFLLMIFSFVIIVAVTAVVVIMFRHKKENEYNQLKQRLFRSQMNPHFLFNALTSIQSFMYKNSGKKAAFYLGSFASLTRSILNNSENEFITLNEELKSLKNYIELEKMRLNDIFEYNFEINEDIETEFVLIPPMLVQPFIENAVKYGIDESNPKPVININFDLADEKLKISVEDNGKGINSRNIIDEERHRSFAIGLFKERIKTLKKDINFEIIDLSELNKNKTGTLVSVEFPLIYNE